MNTASNSTGRDILSTRQIPVPPDLVFQAFTDPECLAKWWGPKGFRNTFHEFDFKTGGNWRFDMHGPDGTDYPNHFLFEEVSPGLIVLRHLNSGHLFTLTITLAPKEGGTRITWRMVFETAHECAAVREIIPRCNEENFDKLEAALASVCALASSDRELRLVRIIDAPQEEVYRCWTEGALLTRWFTPPPWTTPSAELDVRPGGAQAVVMRGPDGEENLHRGVYLEVVKNERLVWTDAFTHAWEPSEAAFMTATLTFEKLPGDRTRYSARILHWSAEDREAHEKMGFHEGWNTATDQLAALAASL